MEHRSIGMDSVVTVFRHFPTKKDLLVAIMKRLLARLVDDADQRDLFGYFDHMVAQAAAKRIVVDLLAGSGVDIKVVDPV